MRKPFLLSIFYFLFFALSGCNPVSEYSSSLPAPAVKNSKLTSLSISPLSVDLTVGEEKRFDVEAKDKEGNILAVTPRWLVEGNIGEISPQGLFKALAVGEGTVKALSDSLMANSLVTIKEKEEFKPFFVYSEYTSASDHFIPSGWMGDYKDITLDENCQQNPHSGETCIKVVYSAEATQRKHWAGIYWQYPADNWGTTDAGFNLSGATKLIFWAKGENGGERIVEFKIGGMRNKYSDSAVAGIGPVVLTNEWKEYEIDLSAKDMSYIIGGFCWASNQTNNPEGCTFYLDDIRYE